MTYILLYLIGAGFNAGVAIGSNTWSTMTWKRKTFWMLLWPYYAARFALIRWAMGRG